MNLNTISFLFIFLLFYVNSTIDLQRQNTSAYFHTNKILTFGPRPTQSLSHQKTLQYMENVLLLNRFQVSRHRFRQATVLGNVTFTNLLARFISPLSNPERRIIFAAHSETKMIDEYPFLGATDSAAPCGILLELAEFIFHQFNQNTSNFSLPTFEFVFFDGEESFKYWSETDSLYGSRELASKWEKESNLKSIELFLLLDILGYKEPSFYGYQCHNDTGTTGKYLQLVDIERELFGNGTIANSKNDKVKMDKPQGHNLDSNGSNSGRRMMFSPVHLPWNIDDDHIPFVKRRVPTVHVIASPFPVVWHTEHDVIDAIDDPTLDRLVKIFKAFLLKQLKSKEK